MANKSLFQSRRGATPPETTDRNEAGGLAYTLTPRHALAPDAATPPQNIVNARAPIPAKTFIPASGAVHPMKSARPSTGESRKRGRWTSCVPSRIDRSTGVVSFCQASRETIP